MKKKTCLALLIAISFVSFYGFLAIVPAPFQPYWVYKIQYEWRYPKEHIIGQAKLLDLGPYVPFDRYFLEFENYRPFQNGKYCYRVKGLPRTRFRFGLNIKRSSGDWDQPLLRSKPLSHIAKLSITNQKGEVVIDEEKRLHEWFWGGRDETPNEAFLGISGKGRNVNEGDTTRYVRLEIKADSGWGTNFVPVENSEYLITLELSGVEHLDPRYSYILMAIGHGWK